MSSLRRVLLLVTLLGCRSGAASDVPQAASTEEPAGDPFDVPLRGATSEQILAFEEGDVLFELPVREADGLGPLYTRTSCGACHAEGARGPGLVQKMSVVEADGVTPAANQSALPFGHTVHPLVAGGGKTPVVPPEGNASIKVSVRVGPPVLGRGYLEAIADAEIVRVVAEQSVRDDGVRGRVNHVVYASQPNIDTTFHRHQPGDVVIGRFGAKARIATLDDFVADALQGDMGITSPLRPVELPNPDGLLDDKAPGVDVGFDSVQKRATYLRLIEIPGRRSLTERGRALFAEVGCATCHVPAMRTRKDYPIAQLADVDAAIYSDLLLHDMGTLLADGLVGVDGEATAREWRTAPLIGLRFSKNHMHDSRAHSIPEAIFAHEGPGSQANASVARYRALAAPDLATLDAFVGAL